MLCGVAVDQSPAATDANEKAAPTTNPATPRNCSRQRMIDSISPVLPGFEHCRHFLMNQVDRLERAEHHFELGDLSGFIPLDHVDAVDGDPFQLNYKFQNGIAFSRKFADVAKRLIEKNVKRSLEILLRDGLSDLRRMHYRRMKDCI